MVFFGVKMLVRASIFSLIVGCAPVPSVIRFPETRNPFKSFSCSAEVWEAASTEGEDSESREPLEVAILDIPSSLSPSQVAAAWCLVMASSRGRASVVGHKLLIKDFREGIERARVLIKTVDPSRIEQCPFTCRSGMKASNVILEGLSSQERKFIPLKIRYLPVRDESLVEQLAATACTELLSERGGAAVLGAGILVLDLEPLLDRVERFVKEIQTPGSGAAPATTPSR